MRFEVETGYLDPIELGQHEWVSVKLPDGRTVTVYDDMINVATADDVFNHRDGFKIWEAMTVERFAYGKTRLTERTG